RNEEHEAHLKESRQPHHQSNHHHRPADVLFSEESDQRVRNLIRSTRFRHHLAQHGSKGHNNRDVSKRVAQARFKRMDYGLQRHAREYSQGQRSKQQSDKRIQLENSNENNQTDHGNQRRDEQKN